MNFHSPMTRSLIGLTPPKPLAQRDCRRGPSIASVSPCTLADDGLFLIASSRGDSPGMASKFGLVEQPDLRLGA